MNSNMFRYVLVLFTLIFVGCASHLPGDGVPRSCVPGEILDTNDCNAACDDGSTHLVCDQSGTTGICAVKPGEVCESSPPAPCQNDPRFNEIGDACTPQGCPSGSGQLFCDGQSVVCVALSACVTPVTCFKDFDGDGIGGTQTKVFDTGVCGTGYVLVTGDCDDTVYSTTNTCSPGTTWYRDADGDGFGCQTSVSASCQTTVSVTQPAGYVANSSDCDDNAPSPTNQCVAPCLPPQGGTLRIEISAARAASCQNRVIVQFDNVGNPRLSALNATNWSEWINTTFGGGSFWGGYVRSQVVCDVTNFAGMQSNLSRWWEYGRLITLPSNGSDMSDNGFFYTFNGIPLTGDTVVSAPGGSVLHAELLECVNN